jgi:hypothetical protein
MMKAFCMLLLLLLPAIAGAQAINNQLSYRAIDKPGYFRLQYENDFFTTTDNNYTQGIYMEFVSPAMKKFPLSYLLFHPRAEHIQYGIAIEHNGYTPNSIEADYILYGQRPYAAVLFLKSFVIATSTVRNDRFSASLSTGVIGPAAGGYEMQAGIHRAINGIQPNGWQYQVKNDLVLNYQADYEKNIFHIAYHLDLNGHVEARIGTLSDKVSAGFTLMTGYFQSALANHTQRRKLQAYLYLHPQVDVVGYDATLQGGLISKDNAYTISPGELERFVVQARAGIVLQYKGLFLEYQQSIISKEFSTGSFHRTGGIEVGVSW